MKYALAPNGVYFTLQGEGHLTGLPMVFVRLAGCSVGCINCDTDYSVHEKVELDEIIRRVLLFMPPAIHDRWVWITGGEPTDFNLRPLIIALKAERFAVAVATAGHKRMIEPVDWLSVSPHHPEKWVQTYGHEVKLVPKLYGAGDFSLEDFYTQHPDDKTDFLFRWVQPLFRNGEVQASTVKECWDFLKFHRNWGLAWQMHKIWQIP